ncbi:UNVERIFIED_CONTAM: Retrovirus-related Pol polyprotein from transposon [Sesamum indicum]
MEEASRNAILAYESRTQPVENETARRRVVRERETERVSEGMSRRAPERMRAVTRSEVGSSSQIGWRRREPAISRADVDSVGRQIHLLGKQIDELKRRGELVTQNKHSPFCNRILSEVVNATFKMPDLPKYDGLKDQQEHVSPFDLVMNLYGQTDSIKAKLFVTTLTGKAQEWFTSLLAGSIEAHEQQKENETLKNFMGRFNNETLEVQDLRIDMMVSILIHGLKKGPFASALARDPPTNVEQLMRLAQKYINEEEMNTMKDGEWMGNALLTVEKSDILKWPHHTRFTPAKKFSSKYCKFHRERGHDTKECYQLKDEIERSIRQGYFKELVLKCRADDNVIRRSRSRSPDRRRDKGKGVLKEANPGNNAPVKGVIYTIAGGPKGGDSRRSRKRQSRDNHRSQLIANIEPEEEITFGNKDRTNKVGSQNDPMVVKLDIANFTVHKVLVDNGSSADIILKDVLEKMGLENARLEPVRTPLVEFGGSEIAPLGTLDLPVLMGDEPRRKTLMVKFLVVDTPFAYNVILGRPALNSFRAVVCTYHLKMKFLTNAGVGEVRCDKEEARKCYNLSLKKGENANKRKRLEIVEESNRVPDEQIQRIQPIEGQKIVEVIPDWLSNVVVVPKPGGKWRVCIDFTDLNKACPKNPYPLPRIDVLVDSTAGYELFSMVDAYQGYHQICMAEEDQSKTSFVTERRIYCYKIGRTMEVYVDDMLVKSSKSHDHIVYLEQTFATLRKFRMKLNPMKCTFGVTGKKFQGYLVSERGTEMNPEKIEAILKLKSPTTVKEVQKLTDLKTYLRSPTLLTNPKENEVLYVYLVVSDNAVSSALVREEDGVQSPIYYMSKMLQGAEKRYAQIEKLALALIVTARKLRPYFQGHRIVVLTNHPLYNVLARPEASGRLVKWAVELGEFDIEYQARTALKGQVLTDFMVEHVSEPETEPELDKWMLHVDGSSNAGNGGIGILIQGPKNVEIEVATRLSFPVTNNEAEYEALIRGLELSLEAGAKDLEVFTDSQLVALQIEGTYKTKEESMILYHTKAKSIMSKFNKCQFGATLLGIRDRKITVMIKETSAITESIDVNAVNEKPSWKDEIARAARFAFVDEQLYKRTIEGPLLKCLDPEKAEYVMREIHEGSSGNHSGGRSLAQKVIRQGYFWPTLVKDTKELVKKCETCQKFAVQIHTPTTQMEPVKIACPFDQWGIDILGPFPTARSQKKFIVVAVEYFSKWVEAEAVAKVTEGNMIEFIWKNIICRFGVPRILISDNGTQFQEKKITSWCKELKIQQNFTAAYRTTPRSSTGETPFYLVFGTEALIPVEIGEKSHRVTMYNPATNHEDRLLDLEVIEEKREVAYAKMLNHKALMMKSYNKRLRPRQFQVGDLVLKKVEVSKHVGSWTQPGKDPTKLQRSNEEAPIASKI